MPRAFVTLIFGRQSSAAVCHFLRWLTVPQDSWVPVSGTNLALVNMRASTAGGVLRGVLIVCSLRLMGTVAGCVPGASAGLFQGPWPAVHLGLFV